MVRRCDEEVRRRVDEEPDFVQLPRYDYSLAQTLDVHPDGLPADQVARALCVEGAVAVEEIHQSALQALRGGIAEERWCVECGDSLPPGWTSPTCSDACQDDYDATE